VRFNIKKRGILLFVIVLVLFFYNCERNVNSDTAQISFDSKEYDFGEIEQHQELPFKFIFKNTGNGMLIISDIKASCNCTIIADFDKEIKPGESSHIGGNFDSDSYTGEIERTIKFKTNDPANSDIKLIIKAVVKE